MPGTISDPEPVVPEPIMNRSPAPARPAENPPAKQIVPPAPKPEPPGSLFDPPPPTEPLPVIDSPPPPIRPEARPDNQGLFVFPDPQPPVKTPAPVFDPKLNHEPPRFAPVPEPQPQKPAVAKPSERQPEERQPPEPKPVPPLEKEPPPLPLPPTQEPFLEPDQEAMPAPPRPLPIEPREPLITEPEHQYPAFRQRPTNKPPQPKTEVRTPLAPPLAPPPELQRRPQPPSEADTESWKKDTSPRDPTGEETPAFRLVKPRPATTEAVMPSSPTPVLKPAPRTTMPGGSLPALSVEKIGPNVARLGETISFELVVRNGGHQVAENLHVVDELPYGIRFVSAEPMPAKQGEKLSWAVPRLHPGEPHRIRLSVQATAAGTFTSRSQVQYHVSTQTQLRIDPADYVVSIHAPRQVPTGQTAPIEIIVNNTTNTSRQGLVLKATLPEGLSHTLGPRVETDVSLQAKESRKFTLSAQALQPGSYTVEAWLEDGEGRFAKTQAEIVVSDQAASAPSPVAQEPPVAASKPPAPDARTAGKLTVRAVGARITRDRDGELRVEIANFTSAAINNLAITATLPATVDFLDASSKGMYHRATKTVYWFVDNVAPGQTQSLVVRVRGKSAGRAEFRVQAGTDAGKRALTQAPVHVEEQTSSSLSLSPRARGEGLEAQNARLAFARKNGYKQRPSDVDNEWQCTGPGRQIVVVRLTMRPDGELPESL
jgi:uncharacterized repeat protein (TIGR01451 family)